MTEIGTGRSFETSRLNVARVSALALLIGGMLLGLQNEAAYRNQLKRSAEAQARTLADSITAAIAFEDAETARGYLSALRANPAVDEVQVWDAQGRLFASYRRSGDIRSGPPPSAPHAARYQGNRVRVAAPIREREERLGVLLLRTTKEPLYAVVLRHGSLALLLTMALFMVWLVSRASVQLERRAQALRNANAELDQANRRLQQEIVERERVEAALRQSQKMEALGQLTGGIAHDFNNLLQVIQGSLDLVMKRAADPRLQRWVQAAVDAAERGAELTRQLLAFSRTQKMRVEPVPVGEMIAAMADLLRRTVGSEVELRLDLRSGGAMALTDRTQLELAVLNLVVNAKDAMPTGGTVTVATEIVEITEERPSLARGAYVALRVEDEGDGMPPDVAQRAFDPFYTTKPVGKGTGLGLSQVYGVAKQAGGTAEIDSEVGRGTTVTMFLSRSASEVQTSTATKPLQEVLAPVQGARVLIVDDDDAVRDLASDTLKMLGYHTLAANTGAHALELLGRERVDIALIDYAMPGMNGAEFARLARQLRPDLPLVFASGHSDTNAIERAAGEDATVLRKPFHMDELAQALARQLKDRRAAPASLG